MRVEWKTKLDSVHTRWWCTEQSTMRVPGWCVYFGFMCFWTYHEDKTRYASSALKTFWRCCCGSSVVCVCTKNPFRCFTHWLDSHNAAMMMKRKARTGDVMRAIKKSWVKNRKGSGLLTVRRREADWGWLAMLQQVEVPEEKRIETGAYFVEQTKMHSMNEQLTKKSFELAPFFSLPSYDKCMCVCMSLVIASMSWWRWIWWNYGGDGWMDACIMEE